ncbi:MAG: hypothetical protein J2P31_17665, partial [Blastocatellia bacterium]|nr:hypothetical protein [Blastocatellia bacterium]
MSTGDDDTAKIGLLTYDWLGYRSIEIQSVYIPPEATSELEYQYIDKVSTLTIGNPTSEKFSKPEFNESKSILYTFPNANAIIVTWKRKGPEEKDTSTTKLIIPLEF